MITLTIPGRPIPQQRHRDRKFGGKYDPLKARKEAFLIQAWKYKPKEPVDFPVSLIVDAYFGADPRTVIQINEIEGQFLTSTPDVDNLLKFPMDALSKAFWLDDRFIVKAQVTKHKE